MDFGEQVADESERWRCKVHLPGFFRSTREIFHSYYVGSGVAFLTPLGLLRCTVVAGKVRQA